MLCQIVECIMPIDYFQLMVGARVDQKIVEQLLRDRMPKLSKHFDQCQFEPSICTLQWFTCLFAYNFQFEVLQKMWDVIFIKGTKMLFSITLAIFDQLESKLLECQSIQEIIRIMDALPNYVNDPTKIASQCSQSKYKVSNHFVRDQRFFQRTKIIDELEHYRLKPSFSKHFERSTFMQRFPLFKGMQQNQTKCLD